MPLPYHLLATVACALSRGDCHGNATVQGPLSVGGTYATAVTLLANTCGTLDIEQHETVIVQRPGDSVLTVTHAGNSYPGKVKRDGTFATTVRTIDAPGGKISIGIVGKFTKAAIDATVTVTMARAKPCEYRVRWQGAKAAALELQPPGRAVPDDAWAVLEWHRLPLVDIVEGSKRVQVRL